MDAVLLGADSITPTALVNKVGSRALAEAAHVMDRPIYAMSSWSKICPVRLSDLVTGERQVRPYLREYVQIFEEVPLERVNMSPYRQRTDERIGDREKNERNTFGPDLGQERGFHPYVVRYFLRLLCQQLE